MDPSLLPYYKRRIKRESKDREINAVVIDVRFNPGGSDYCWNELSNFLIKDPVYSRLSFVFKDTAMAFNAVSTSYNLADYLAKNKKVIQVPYLGTREFILLADDVSLQPNSDSMRFACPIYILSQDIYSSTGGFLKFARECDQMTSIGIPSSVQLGYGFDPVAFILPNSRFIFTLSAVLDITHCDNVNDIYSPDVEIPLDLSLDETLAYWNSNIDGCLWLNYWVDNESAYETWLTTEDPFFKKVMQLKQKIGKK